MYKTYMEIRNARGLKDADVAKATGIGKSTFSDWKSGRSSPKQEKLQKIADFLGVSLKYLMTGKDDEPEKPVNRDLKEEYARLERQLRSGELSPLYFDGQPVDEESIDLLLKQVQISIALLEKNGK